MWGISWGGFNALQVAALRPPELKAIISVASTVDRYAADVHYNGGCVLGSEMVGWATSMLSRTALPPTPRIVEDGWKRGVARSAGGDSSLHRRMVAAPDPRRFWAARLRLRGLRRDHGPVPGCRRICRRVFERPLFTPSRACLIAPGDWWARGRTITQTSVSQVPISASSNMRCGGGTTG